jgi:hypothetical protein
LQRFYDGKMNVTCQSSETVEPWTMRKGNGLVDHLARILPQKVFLIHASASPLILIDSSSACYTTRDAEHNSLSNASPR